MITIKDYINNPILTEPCFVQGDSLKALSQLSDGCIDCVVTSPPYYMKRQYLGGGIGLESTYKEYIDNLKSISIICLPLFRKYIVFLNQQVHSG